MKLLMEQWKKFINENDEKASRLKPVGLPQDDWDNHQELERIGSESLHSDMRDLLTTNMPAAVERLVSRNDDNRITDDYTEMLANTMDHYVDKGFYEQAKDGNMIKTFDKELVKQMLNIAIEKARKLK
tara:strand:- start:176 stop:559 length:384 start_codon:yes stop_codon:yes gene_type:complete